MPKGKGGIRQSLGCSSRRRSRSPRRTTTPDPSIPCKSQAAAALRIHVCKKFLGNKTSSKDIHEWIKCSSDSGAQGVEDLASCGAHGRLHKNLARDLKRRIIKQCDFPEPYLADILVRDPKTNQVKLGTCQFLLPHEVLQYLLDSGRMQMDQMTNYACRHTWTNAFATVHAFFLT
jgi:hypothetical protein